jgi:hypothetical protein
MTMQDEKPLTPALPMNQCGGGRIPSLPVNVASLPRFSSSLQWTGGGVPRSLARKDAGATVHDPEARPCWEVETAHATNDSLKPS